MTKKKILVVGGGYSKERIISLKTSKAVINSIKKLYNVKFCEPDQNFASIIKTFKPDVIFNALHGRFGEDGFIQSIFESLNVKYTHSGVLSSMLAMDKELSKYIFLKNKILTPKFIKYSFNNHKNKKKLLNNLKKKLNFPLVLKPLNEGSSVNVFISDEKNLFKNLNKLKSYGEILMEKYIPGREIQVAILSEKVLGAIELEPKRKFYDYQAKYNPKARTKHIIPVNISKSQYNKLTKIALKTHKILKCRGVSRSDFRFYNNKFYLLEINTQPGMTSLSLVPEIAKFNNITFKNLIEKILKDASTNK